MEDWRIEQMTPEDVKTLHEWAVQEEWNMTLQDFKALYDADPSAFFVARKNSKMIGSISGTRHEDKFGCLGCLIIEKGHRGQGLARLLMTEVIRFLGVENTARNSFLSGRFNVVQTYNKYGFKVSSWDVVSYFCKSPTLHNLSVPITDGLTISHVDEVDRQSLVDYDEKLNLTRREALLNNVFSKQGSETRVGQVDDTVVGYGTIQPATWGYRIAPLYANSSAVARALVKALLESVGGATEGLSVDSVSENVEFEQIAQELNMTERYRLKRLYTRSEVNIDTSRVYGLCNTDMSII